MGEEQIKCATCPERVGEWCSLLDKVGRGTDSVRTWVIADMGPGCPAIRPAWCPRAEQTGDRDDCLLEIVSIDLKRKVIKIRAGAGWAVDPTRGDDA